MNLANRATQLSLRRRFASDSRARFTFRFLCFVTKETHNLIARRLGIVRRSHRFNSVGHAKKNRAFHTLANPFKKVEIHLYPILFSAVRLVSTVPGRLRFIQQTEGKKKGAPRQARFIKKFHGKKNF